MKFQYNEDGNPRWNEEIAEARRRKMLMMMRQRGEIADKPKPPLRFNDDVWKKRDRS